MVRDPCGMGNRGSGMCGFACAATANQVASHRRLPHHPIWNMKETKDVMEKAIQQLGYRRLFRNGRHEFVVALLVRDSDSRPLEATWWRGKQVSIIGADIHGNFFLRHSGGSVLHWDHTKKVETLVASSIKEFVSKIVSEHDTDWDEFDPTIAQ